jgi:hypothetical protein
MTLGQLLAKYLDGWDMADRESGEAWLKTFNRIQGWRQEGKGAALYQNQELGHPEMGHLQIISFGTPEAGLPMDEPPQTMPDFPDRINWRYQLVGFVPKEDKG